MLTEPLREVRVNWIFGLSGVPRRNQKPRPWPQKPWHVSLVPGAGRGGRCSLLPSLGQQRTRAWGIVPSCLQGYLGPEYEGKAEGTGKVLSSCGFRITEFQAPREA